MEIKKLLITVIAALLSGAILGTAGTIVAQKTAMAKAEQIHKQQARQIEKLQDAQTENQHDLNGVMLDIVQRLARIEGRLK